MRTPHFVAALIAAYFVCDQSWPSRSPAAEADAKSIEAKSVETKPAELKSKETKNLSFDGIKFEMAKGEKFLRKMLTPQIEKLDGSKVRIRGYILPGFQNSDLTSFVLVRDNMECCFGPGAAIYDCIMVDLEEGKTTNFTNRPVAVEGEFHVRELKLPDGAHVAIYHLTAEQVR